MESSNRRVSVLFKSAIIFTAYMTYETEYTEEIISLQAIKQGDAWKVELACFASINNRKVSKTTWSLRWRAVML